MLAAYLFLLRRDLRLRRREVEHVDQQVRSADAGSAFARNFAATCHVHHVKLDLDQFGTEAGSKVIPTAFQKDDVEVAAEAIHQQINRVLIGKDVVTDSSVGAVTRLHTMLTNVLLATTKRLVVR